jgi:hypothetical protein
MRAAKSFALLATLVCLLFAEPARAQRVFVSATGNDVNACTYASPCRSFQHAHDVSPANGEIDVLDPAGYGALIISKAISIQGHGFSGISVSSGGVGMTINVAETDTVHLNGLLIEGDHVGASGIAFNSGHSLTVENCVVRSMVGAGFQFLSNATTLQTLAVSNSYFNDNGAGAMYIEGKSSGSIVAVIDQTGFYGGAGGLTVYGTLGTGALAVAVTNSVAANTNGPGFLVESESGSVSDLSMTQSLAEGNGIGIEAKGATATIWLADSTATGNGVGYKTFDGGLIKSYSDNFLAAANASNAGSLSSIGTQ